LSSTIANRLKNQTSTLVNTFSSRADRLKDRCEFKALFKHLYGEEWLEAAKSFFNAKEGFAVGIDGSMDYDERLEMILFYICVTAYKCPILFDGKSINVNTKATERDSRFTASAAIPLWLDDTSYTLNPLTSTDVEFEFKQALDRIPYAIMTLGELSLALNIINQEDVKVLFLDRPLAGTFGPAARDLRLLLKLGTSTLTEIETKEGNLSMLDLSLASVLGPGTLYIPARPPYLLYRAIQTLIQRGELTKSELARELNLKDEELNKLVRKLNELNERYNQQLLERSDLTTIALKPQVKNYWVRARAVADAVRKRVFESEEHPLQLHEDKWLTVLDINAVNVFLIYELLQQAQKKGVLVIGVTKDTVASDFTRSIIPYAIHQNILKSSDTPLIRNDKAFLTILTSVNEGFIETPWRTLSYDVCFTTLVKSGDQRAPLRAARKVVFREKFLVKSYFQLKTFATDNRARSPVFVYDRFYHPVFDEAFCKPLNVLSRDKVIQIEPYVEDGGINPLDNLILTILSHSDNPEVLEAIGHNQLLYLADKAVKAEVNLMRSMLRGVADLHLGTLTRKHRYFYIAKGFRGARAEIEESRRRAARVGGLET